MVKTHLESIREVDRYRAAETRIAAIQAEEGKLDLNPVCRTQLLTQGRRAERVIAFLHGYTSCPQQFALLAEEFFKLGYNVYLPRLPYHGLTDRFSNHLVNITTGALVAFGDEVAGIAAGLGEKVTICGLSGGGTLTLWLYQSRPEVDLAVAISPFLGAASIPSALTGLFSRLLSTLPDRFYWWDPIKREKNPLTAYYAYPGLSTHGLGGMLHLGFTLRKAAEKGLPAGKRILVITNANDRTVNNHLTAQLVASWRKLGVNVQTYEFEPALELPHDVIGPHRPDQKIDLVYPVLLDLATQA
jgi:carboxylesterase